MNNGNWPDWPYNSEAASRILDPELIERQGDFFLRRALNIRRLVVFAGSGLSMAYGRVSWVELAETQITGILSAKEALSEDEQKKISSPLAELLTRLVTLRDAINDNATDVIVLALQLSEQVWLLAQDSFLDSLKNEFRSNDESGNSEDVKRKLFRHCVKAETYDERHHARRILSDPFGSGETIDNVGRFARTKLVHGRLERFPPHGNPDLERLFAIDTVQDIKKHAEQWGQDAPEPIQPLYNLASEIACLLEKHCKPPSPLDPINYPGVGLALDAMRAGFRLDRIQKPDLRSLAEKFENACKSTSSGSVRERFVTRERDPLWTLAMNLEVKRFITTNYDLDIERLIDDLGFRPTAYDSQAHLVGDEVERIGPMGGRARDIVLGASNAAEMIDFASGESPHHLQVMHVHGRATDSEDIVVTERDYQNMYLGESANKTVAREGMQVLFGGNPVLFAGIGLSEGDLMRPLREFAMQHLRRNHSVIALAPAAKEKGDRSQFVMEQYIRHGVYVLHYGFRNDGEGKACWLEAVFKYTKTIKDILDALSSSEKFKEKYLSNAQSIIGKAIDETTVQLLKALGLDDIKSIEKLECFLTDGSECSISLEIGMLTRIGEFLKQHAPALRTRFDSTDRERNQILDKLFKTVLTRAVKRIEDAIRTIALSAYLRGLEIRWRKWAETWSRMPKTRSEEFNFSTLEDIRGHAKTPQLKLLPAQLARTRWFRHLVDDAWTEEYARFECLLNAWRPARSEIKGRRLLLIAAPRGAGKGSLLGELTRFGDFLLNRSQKNISLRFDAPEFKYAAQFLINLSFSSEISSAWDAFSAFLLNPLQPVAHETLNASVANLGRIGRIRLAIANLRERLDQIARDLQAELGDAENIVPRCLVVFQAFDLLFEADGYPKTAEIRAICDLLFGSVSEGAPIDLVLILKDSRIPLYFRREGSEALSPDRNVKCPGRSVRLVASPGAPEIVASMIVKADLKVDAEASDEVTQAISPLLPPLHLGGTFSNTYVHFLEDNAGPQRTSIFDAGEWTSSLFPLLSKNRLQLRLFLRVASDITERSPEAQRNRILNEFALALIGVENSQGQLATDRFFEKMLDYWQCQSKPLPADELVLGEILGPRNLNHFVTILATHAYDFKLHELLLRHLSVISTPVEADVLVICPQIKARLTELLSRDDLIPKAEGRQLIVECALAILANRGLIFAIHKRKVRGTDADQKPASARYQVHRLMQLHIYRKLGAQNAEPADSYTFALSLFASQSRELPLLVANAYAFLHELVNELVGFPRPSGEIPFWEPADLQVRCLKAGIGVARTLFAIGVVARFDDLGGVSVQESPRPGYFEHHRLILRWMLLQASDIGRAKSKDTGRAESNPEQPIESDVSTNAAQMPFYPDEIIWLFNECGVFSLAQGQMFDAIAMFEAALKAAGTVEGRANGSLRRRILLNLALCSIYRGRATDARRMLNEVKSEESEDKVIQLIATGHLGLLDHIGGSHESALHNLNVAITGLLKLKRFRSVSMFLRHRGDLYRDLQNFPDAERDLAEAIDVARLSGSQDMVWFAIVARARLDVTKGINLKNLARTLEDAEHYADAMELPLLIAETCFVHAQMLLRQGETALAGEKATRALRLATLHGLTLRSIAYRNLLADIHAERGWGEEAKRIRGQALQAARNAGYRLILQRNPQETR